jgi:glycosyltransferase involved in cell wall biosynthesis
VNRAIYRKCAGIIALDEHMAIKIAEAGAPSTIIAVATLWPTDGDLQPVVHESNDFRLRLDIGDRILVMYSGNQTRSNPLQTLLDVALELRSDDRFRFCFIGGGALKPEIEAFRSTHGLTSMVVLPYQPREMLARSLSAADIHAVTLGDAMVGVIHPCKVYNVLAVGRPILYFGPPVSHVADILDHAEIGWAVRHGDVVGAVAALRELATLTANERRKLEARCRAVVNVRFPVARLQNEFSGLVERIASGGPHAHD